MLDRGRTHEDETFWFMRMGTTEGELGGPLCVFWWFQKDICNITRVWHESIELASGSCMESKLEVSIHFVWYWTKRLLKTLDNFLKDESIPRILVLELHFSEIVDWWCCALLELWARVRKAYSLVTPVGTIVFSSLKYHPTSGMLRSLVGHSCDFQMAL